MYYWYLGHDEQYRGPKAPKEFCKIEVLHINQ